MLDYAANGSRYWPVDHLRTWFEQMCQRAGQSPEEVLASVLGVSEVNALWERVSTNIQAGKMRLLFVADQIPPAAADLRAGFGDESQGLGDRHLLAVETRGHRCGGTRWGGVNECL